MREFKLKSLYLRRKKDLKRDSLQDLVILTIDDPSQEQLKYHRFQVPLNAYVEIHYETPEDNGLLRFIFQLNRQNLIIQYFIWNEIEQHYIEVALENQMLQSLSFQMVLQGINFTGKNHFSYIVNSRQTLTDTLARKKG